MRNHLYIRTHARLGHAPEWRFHSKHATYHAAIIKGQELKNHNGFTIETPGRIPTREEQLLLPLIPVVRNARGRKRKLTKEELFLAEL